jgi:hypothetical protein
VLSLIATPIPDGSFLKLCPTVLPLVAASKELLPIVEFRAFAGLEMARVPIRIAVTPPFFVAVEDFGSCV